VINEDEAAQKKRKAEKARMKKLRDLNRLLEANNETGEVWRPEKRHSFDLERFARTKTCR
jgi:hypothetical protein